MGKDDSGAGGFLLKSLLTGERHTPVMARLWLLEAPDWATLEWAAARYEATRSEQAWAHLDAALYEFLRAARCSRFLSRASSHG